MQSSKGNREERCNAGGSTKRQYKVKRTMSEIGCHCQATKERLCEKMILLEWHMGHLNMFFDTVVQLCMFSSWRERETK